MVGNNNWGLENVFHFFYARYATDVKFQQLNQTSGRYGERRQYVSGNIYLYSYNVEASITVDEDCVGYTK